MLLTFWKSANLKKTVARLAAMLVFALAIFLNTPAKAQIQDITMADVVREADAGNYEVAYRHLEVLARGGDAQAQGFLSYVLSIGEWHVSVDLKRAQMLLQSALEQGDGYAHTAVGIMNEPDADIQYGDLYIYSDDYLANYLAAAKAGNPYAQWAMAIETRYQKKYNESLEWFKKSAAAGFVFAKSKLIITEDIERSSRIKDMARLLGMSTTGFPEIYYHLANSYKRGFGVRRDLIFALTYAKLTLDFSGGLIEIDLFPYRSGLSKQEQEQALAQAELWMFEWANNPVTHLGKAAKWCKSSEYWNVSCISNAALADIECSIPYMTVGFKAPHEFPGYSKCRYKRRMFPYF